jgi:hypothetical protein
VVSCFTSQAIARQVNIITHPTRDEMEMASNGVRNRMP